MIPGSYRSVIAAHRDMPADVQWYYQHLPSLTVSYPWGVTLAYMFSRLEAGQRRSLYAGLINATEREAQSRGRS